MPRTHIDDEYATSKYREPLLFITTSKDPSPRLMQMQKELNLIFPSAIRMNRGGYVLNELTEMAQKREVTDLVIIHEHRGVPDGMIISHLPVGPTIYFGLFDVVLRHDLRDKADNVSEASPHLIFDGFETKLGLRVTEILKHLFPVPKPDSKRVVTFKNNKDTISFRNFTHSKADYKSVDLAEMGPRFEMKPFQIVQGLLNQPEANKEWVIRNYINTAGKKTYL